MTTLRLSNSEMKEYRRCKRKWYLSTYRRLGKLAPDLPGEPLSIGNVVHDALAAYYESRQPRKRKVIDPVAWAEQQYAVRIQEVPQYAESLEKERQLTTIMLQGYLEWLEETGADADLRIVGAETMVEVVIVPESEHGSAVHLISKLDAPVERISDGAKLVLEHKTVGSLDRPLETLKLDTQLLSEHLARFLHDMEAGASADEAYDQCQGVLYNMLRKVKRSATAKPPFYGREDIIHNRYELRNHWRHVLAVAREIQATTKALNAGGDHHTLCAPNPTRDCSWDCDFFKVCVMFDDGSNAEGALNALYEERDPLQRYADSVRLALPEPRESIASG